MWLMHWNLFRCDWCTEICCNFLEWYYLYHRVSLCCDPLKVRTDWLCLCMIWCNCGRICRLCATYQNYLPAAARRYGGSIGEIFCQISRSAGQRLTPAAPFYFCYLVLRVHAGMYKLFASYMLLEVTWGKAGKCKHGMYVPKKKKNKQL